MRILLTNDDGYFAEGLIALCDALTSRGHDVYVSAPAGEQSCSGHALTLRGEIYAKAVDFKAFTAMRKRALDVACVSVQGTPADSVKFGLREFFKDVKFDVVISGINTVMNVGSDCIYSGTFAAASEGALLGVPSIAVSAEMHHVSDYSFPAEFLATNLDALIKYAKPFTCVNVNVPSADAKDIKGVKATHMGWREYNDSYALCSDGGYAVQGEWINCESSSLDDDSACVDKGYIAIVPVPLLVTDEAALDAMKKEKWTL